MALLWINCLELSCFVHNGSTQASVTFLKLLPWISTPPSHPLWTYFYLLLVCCSPFNACSSRVYGGDALDAFAHSPLPVIPTYVSIDGIRRMVPTLSDSSWKDMDIRGKTMACMGTFLPVRLFFHVFTSTESNLTASKGDRGFSLCIHPSNRREAILPRTTTSAARLLITRTPPHQPTTSTYAQRATAPKTYTRD